MVLYNLIKYIPKGTEIHSEDDIKYLLDDIRTDLSLLNANYGQLPLKNILNIIENEDVAEHSHHEPRLLNKVDFSAAKEIINNYRHLSEGGCQSCHHKALYKDDLGDNVTYCNLLEKEENLDETAKRIGMSNSIVEFSEHGCLNKMQIFRPLEEVLNG
ncbi:MAG: hypothetical protein WC781_00420 [Candidatus Pacearchaeota archaeon]|jgi:hypothetical protein